MLTSIRSGYLGLSAIGALIAMQSHGQSYGAGGAWQQCARENQTCSLQGPANLRFGAQGAYTYHRVPGSVRCDVQTFGDPVPGQRKNCEVQVINATGYGQQGQYSDQGFAECAREGRLCEARGSATIRYGAAGRFAYLDVYNEAVPCDNNAFGDPAPGQRKRCEIRPNNQAGYGNQGYGNGQGVPIGVPPVATGPVDGVWQNCAKEGRTCQLPGPAFVRYGADGAFVLSQVSGGEVYCDNNHFSDPAPGRRKRCEFQPMSQYGVSGAGGSAPWRSCARENGYCQVGGWAIVRYGDGAGRPVLLEVQNGIQCSNQAFGVDPAPGRRKGCEFLLVGGR